jgi:hypothetical protein
MDGNFSPRFSNDSEERIFIHTYYNDIVVLCRSHFSSCGAYPKMVSVGWGNSVDAFVVGPFETNNMIVFPFEILCNGKTITFTEPFVPSIELDNDVHGTRTSECINLDNSEVPCDNVRLEVSRECTLVARIGHESIQQILRCALQCMGYKRNGMRCRNRRQTTAECVWCHHHESQKYDFFENPTKYDWWNDKA